MSCVTSLKSLRLRKLSTFGTLVTFGCLWLALVVAYGYLCLPFVTFVYLCLPFLTFPYPSLPFLTFSLSFLSFPYLSLPFPTFPYLSLPFLALFCICTLTNEVMYITAFAAKKYLYKNKGHKDLELKSGKEISSHRSEIKPATQLLNEKKSGHLDF